MNKPPARHVDPRRPRRAVVMQPPRPNALGTLVTVTVLGLAGFFGSAAAAAQEDGTDAPRPDAPQANAPQPNETVDAVLAQFRALPGLSTRFTEEKRIALLRVPVRSEGEIHFTRPGLMVRRVTSPAPSVALLDGDSLVLVADGREERISLGENDVVRAFVATFRHILAGDRAELERTFRMELATEGDRWTLTLHPRDQALRRFLRVMTLEGTGTGLETMRWVERGGDETRLRFTEVRAPRRFSAAERERIFSTSLSPRR
jgi:outer membrane lipoprotein-sorting protein